MKIKGILAGVVTAAILAGAVLVVGPAMAAGPAGQPGQQAGQPGARMGGGPGMMGLALGRTNGSLHAEVAKFLGVSEADLTAARQAGKSLAQVASEKGIAEDKLVEFLVGQRSAQVDKLVADGKITKEQADLHKQSMTERVKANVKRTATGPVWQKGQGGGRGGMGGRMGQGQGMGHNAGNCPNLNAPAK